MAHRAGRHRLPVVVLLALVAATLQGPAAFGVSSQGGRDATGTDSGTDRWIVVLHQKGRTDPDVARTVTDLATRLRFRPGQVYDRVVPGFAAALDARQLAAVRTDPRVRYVHRDRALELTAQVESAAIRRVNAHLAPATRIDEVDGPGDRVDADIAILDTGVDIDHVDLDVAGGIDCSEHVPDSSPPGHDDLHGHGTHVAGIAAAIDNGIGVVGVAPGARIWSVRIFGRDINGWESNLLCGIEWVTEQRDGDRPKMEVANMSLRIGEDDDGDPVGDDGQCGQSAERPDPVHAAICASVQAGNVYAVAAGNERNDASVYIPAAYDEVITVSALADFDGLAGGLAATPTSCRSNANGVPDVDDTFADFSTRGADVDLIAPGVCVSSTYRGGGYRSLSGTSMATPAVAGGAALYRLAHPEADPMQVRAGLIAAGNHDWATQTDPDGMPERLLDVRSAGAPADFGLDVRPAVRGVPAGGSRGYDVALHRGFAFTDGVSLSLDTSGLPAGVTAGLSLDEMTALDQIVSRLTVTVPDGTPDGPATIDIDAVGGPGPTEHGATAQLIIDSVAPTVGTPVARFIPGSLPGPDTIPVRVSWSGGDASGTERYEVDRRMDGSPWATIASLGPGTTGITNHLSPSHSYRFRVQGTDLAGNATTTNGPPVLLRSRSEASPTIEYHGDWSPQRAVGAYGGWVRHASEAGAEASLTFVGRAFAWLSPVSAARGSAEVFVDDVLVATVDLQNATRQPSRVVFAAHWHTSVERTVRIRVVGTDGHSRIDVDHIVTLR